uniref:Serine-threonine/tyrosine-protein kinase catalytic domain-containing protein n=1 Tax=Arundo donax TaxID=35708 RepID=A0A0A8ZX19_ARUDO
MRGDYDVNSVWKVAEMALHCTKQAGRDRPTMTEIVEGLKDSLQLEMSSSSKRCNSTVTSDSIGVLETEQIGECHGC